MDAFLDKYVLFTPSMTLNELANVNYKMIDDPTTPQFYRDNITKFADAVKVIKETCQAAAKSSGEVKAHQ